MRAILTISALTLALCACHKPEPANVDTVQLTASPAATADPVPASPVSPASPFQSTARQDAFGYYIPTADVRFGFLKLSHLAVGMPSDFIDWEKGRRSATFSPVMLEFEDLQSPETVNELGQGRHAVVRVLPTAYRFDGASLHFEGTHPRLGQVVLDARLDPAARAAAAAQGSSATPVLQGALAVGSIRVESLSFTWFAGE